MTDWSQPQDVSDVLIAFPGRVMHLMPSRDEAEAALDALPLDERQKWLDFQRRWFNEGLPDTFQVALRTNGGVKVDGNKAFRHLKCVQGSFEPKHEHKVASVAFLASQWFEDCSWEGFDLVETDAESPA